MTVPDGAGGRSRDVPQTQHERKAETRARLLAAAADLFAGQGVDAVSVDAVAEAAGRTSGAVYAHFGSKQGLLLALLDSWKDSVLAVLLAEVAVSESPREQLAAVWANVADGPKEETDAGRSSSTSSGCGRPGTRRSPTCCGPAGRRGPAASVLANSASGRPRSAPIRRPTPASWPCWSGRCWSAWPCSAPSNRTRSATSWPCAASPPWSAWANPRRAPPAEQGPGASVRARRVSRVVPARDQEADTEEDRPQATRNHRSGAAP